MSITDSNTNGFLFRDAEIMQQKQKKANEKTDPKSK